MRKKLEILEYIFFIVSILYYTGTINFLGGVTSADNPALQESGESSAILSLIQYGILAITLLLVVIRRNQISYFVSKRKFLLVFTGLILISFLWSPVPDLTLRRALIFLGVSLFGLSISARYTIKEQLYLFAWAMGIIVVINLLFTLALPSIGIEGGEHAGAWRGVYPQKNVSSRMFVLSSLILLLAKIGTHRYRYILAVLLGLSVVLTLLSASKGALVILLVMFALVPLFQALQLNNTWVLPLLVSLLLIGSSIAILLISNSETIVKFLGRDLTLTGRTGIWSVVISKIALHPWLGYGYKGFWLGMEGDSADVWYETFFMAPNAHNGWLDITVQLGLVGLFFFLLSYIKNCLRAIAWLRLNHTVEGLLPVLYLTFIFLYNLAETTLLDPAQFIWVMYTSITTTVLTQPIVVKDFNSPFRNNTFKRLKNV
ncbi:MAG: O-antigen ligase family protein [Aulosira sp. ZfuVER01]|nr:O-antigen ligase [Aulosira sp. ZfuVER01]MDZ8001991.1 O-antigen ligase [Aulosira sp. DedVER01a]MDZ8054931.1 O-antigen ligase [Aulosira sp. ZfuCHP01]